VRGAVTLWGLKLEQDLPGCVGLHTLVGQSRARDVVAKLLDHTAALDAQQVGLRGFRYGTYVDR
jgi:hypothetical protein